MSEIDNDILRAIREMAAQLGTSRRRFSTYYDRWVAMSGGIALPRNFLEAVFVANRNLVAADQEALAPAQSDNAIALAILALKDRQQMILFLGAAKAEGLIEPKRDDDPDKLNSIFGALLALLGSERKPTKKQSQLTLQSFHPQGLTDLQHIWTDPGELLPAFINVLRRLCRIRIWNDEETDILSQGTGFLVGPSSVLTNYHVVEKLIKREATASQVTIEFERPRQTQRRSGDSHEIHELTRQGAIRFSEAHGEPDQETDRAWWADKPNRSAWLDSVSAKLDYAVLKLDSAPGLLRGWYDLAKLPDTRRSGRAWVFQHPAGQDIKIDSGAIFYGRSSKSRVFHAASTTEGSSGGLIVNEKGMPIGLHYGVLKTGETPPKAPTNMVNVGIRLASIVDDLKAKSQLAEIDVYTGLRPTQACTEDGAPIFGRDTFFTDLKAFYDGDANPLVVNTDGLQEDIKKPGKSFSKQILKGVFGQDGHIYVDLSAQTLPARAIDLANEIIQAIAPGNPLITDDDSDTTSAAMVERYANELQLAISQRASNAVVWLCIDDLDDHQLPDSDVRDLLSELYRRAPSNLKILLIGLSGTVTIGGFTDKVRYSSITDRDVDNRVQLFDTWLRTRSFGGEKLTDTAISLLSETAASVAGDEQPLREMSDYVKKHLGPAIDRVYKEEVTDE